MDCCGREGQPSGDARFEIKTLADGVHVAVAAPRLQGQLQHRHHRERCGVVIVDTHSKLSAARVIVERLRDLTPRPVRYVVNTHFHWDHWHGNEVYPAAYPNAEIVTNQITREAMVKKGLKRIRGLRTLCRRVGKRQEAQEHLATATTMYREMDMTFWLEQAEAEIKGGSSRWAAAGARQACA